MCVCGGWERQIDSVCVCVEGGDVCVCGACVCMRGMCSGRVREKMKIFSRIGPKIRKFEMKLLLSTLQNN